MSITDAENSIRNALAYANDEEVTSITHAMVAQAFATIELVEQQRIANMQTERSALKARAIGRHDDTATRFLETAADLDGQIREAMGLS